MRLVQVFVPQGNTELVLETVEATGVDYAVSEETSRGEFEAVVSIPVPPAAVESLLSALRSAGLDADSYIVVTAAETIISDRTTALTGRFGATRISREELQARAKDLAPATSTYVVLFVVSTIIATAGPLLDSAATIIGAMVVVTAETLVLVNLFSINLIALILFWISGYRPTRRPTSGESTAGCAHASSFSWSRSRYSRSFSASPPTGATSPQRSNTTSGPNSKR